MADGSVLRSHVANARGSASRPMTDAELDAKFRMQANGIPPSEKAEALLRLCRDVGSLQDAGKQIDAALAI